MLNVGETQYAILRDTILDELEFAGSSFVSSAEVYPKKDMSYAKKLEGYNKRLNAPLRNGDMYISEVMKEGMR